MHAVLFYGRLIARRAFSTVLTESKSLARLKPDLRLVAASSGFAKSITRAQLLGQFNAAALSRWKYGDDACFISKNEAVDVIGKFLIKQMLWSKLK